MISQDILVIGFGNPGRYDDGLGPAVAEALEERNMPGVKVDADYQLMVEDAAAVAEHEIVIFVDADASGPEPFSFQKIEPKADVSFSSHSVEPSSVVGLAKDLFGAKTTAYILGIRGYHFDGLGHGLSEQAKKNFETALEFLVEKLENRDFSV